MKVIGKIVGGLAAFVFMLGMCGIDSNPGAALSMMLVSGIVLAAFAGVAHFEEEEKRLKLKEGRR